jgi:hypothetical protein
MLTTETLHEDFGNMWYVSNLEIYAGTHPVNIEHSMAFTAAGRLNQIVWDKGHSAYMDG